MIIDGASDVSEREMAEQKRTRDEANVEVRAPVSDVFCDVYSFPQLHVYRQLNHVDVLSPLNSQIYM